MTSLADYRRRHAHKVDPPEEAEVTEVVRRASDGETVVVPRSTVADAIRTATSSIKGHGGAHRKMPHSSGLPDAELKFGKHKGAFVSELAARDPGYLRWLLSKPLHPTTCPDGFPTDLLDIVRRWA